MHLCPLPSRKPSSEQWEVASVHQDNSGSMGQRPNNGSLHKIVVNFFSTKVLLGMVALLYNVVYSSDSFCRPTPWGHVLQSHNPQWLSVTAMKESPQEEGQGWILTHRNGIGKGRCRPFKGMTWKLHTSLSCISKDRLTWWHQEGRQRRVAFLLGSLWLWERREAMAECGWQLWQQKD
jgi:hypothetical protein